MHEVDKPYLKCKNINKYFERLSEVLIDKGSGSYRFLVVGGAVMALKYRFGRASVDIDICLREQTDLYKYCIMVADECKLPYDWINADVMHSDSFSMNLFKNAELYKVYNNILSVYTVSDLDLFCMKLVSIRPKDMNDLNQIATRLKRKGISRKMIINEFIFLYGSLFLLKDRQKSFLYKNFK